VDTNADQYKKDVKRFFGLPSTHAMRGASIEPLPAIQEYETKTQ